MTHILDRLYGLLWGGPMLVLISGVGVWLTICTRCAQVRLFPQSLRRLFRKSSPEEGGISPFRALCTALAATVGTGNLVGVAGAICLGGAGLRVLDDGVCILRHGGQVRRSRPGHPLPGNRRR